MPLNLAVFKNRLAALRQLGQYVEDGVGVGRAAGYKNVHRYDLVERADGGHLRQFGV